MGIILPEITPLAGKRIDRLQFPRGSSLVAVIRDDNVLVPKVGDALEPGDELIFVASGMLSQSWQRLFGSLASRQNLRCFRL